MTCKQSKSAYRVGKRIGAKQKHPPQYTTQTTAEQYLTKKPRREVRY